LFAGSLEGEGIIEPEVTLNAMKLGEEVVEDYVSMRLSLRAHPMELLRPGMDGLTANQDLLHAPPRRHTVCGLVITRQRPGTASGVVFVTLEDETGVCNVIVWRAIYKKFRKAVISGRLLKVSGVLQREGIVTHLIAQNVEDMSGRLAALGHPEFDIVGETTAVTDTAPRPARARHPREQAKVLFPSRDFH